MRLMNLFMAGSFVLLFACRVGAAEKIPRDDFIKYTETCLDVFDEMELAYSKYDIPLKSVEDIDKKDSLCISKFNRFGDYHEWDESGQKDITKLVFKTSTSGMLIKYKVQLISEINKILEAGAGYQSNTEIAKSGAEIESAKSGITEGVTEITETKKQLQSKLVVYKEQPKEQPRKKKHTVH